LYFIYNSNDNHDHSQFDKSSHIMPRIITRPFLFSPLTLCISAREKAENPEISRLAEQREEKIITVNDNVL
ncbi:hypothetical protein ACSLOJ_25730, partial [Escherichia coli]